MAGKEGAAAEKLEDIGLSEVSTDVSLSMTHVGKDPEELEARTSVDAREKPGAAKAAATTTKEEVAEDLIEGEGDAGAEAEETTEATEETSEANPPTEEEQKTQALEQKVAGYREKRREARGMSRVRTERQKLTTEKSEIDGARKALEAIGWRPGMSEADLFKSVVNKALQKDDPEAKARAEAEAKEQAERAKEERVERLERELHAERSQRTQAIAEKRFLDRTQDPKFEIVHDIYEQDELVALGNQIASSWLANAEALRKAGRVEEARRFEDWEPETIADTILDLVTAKEKRRQERQKAREASKTSTTAATDGAPKASAAKKLVNGTKPKTLTNDMASAVAGNGQRPLKERERLSAAAALIK